jgi:peptide/nickel transport system substrate-binding protein
MQQGDVVRARMKIALLVALGALVAACGGGTTAAVDRPADGAPRELRLAVGGESEQGYDPTLGWGQYGNPLFHSTLLTRDVDLELQGDLATDWSVSDDGLTYTVELRDDARFTDGEPVTAEDVAYTYNTARESGGLVDVTVLDEAVALDEHTVELRLNQPWSTFVGRMATLGIVPAHAHGDGYGRQPIGSGPWVFERWDEGQQLVVTRNDDYYGELPAFERVVFLFTGEDASMAAARAGEVHVASIPSALADQRVAGMVLVAAESVDNRGISFPFPPRTGETDHQGVPIGNDVTSDLAIRRAVNHAIDRQALVEGILNGHGTPAFTPADGLPWGNPDAAVDDGDVEEARRILADGGWEDTDGDGIVDKDGVRAEFDIVYRSTDTDRQGLAIAVADQLRAIGLDVTPRGLPGSESFALAPSQPVLFGWGSHDASELYQLHHSSLAETEDIFNANRFVDPYVDEQLELAMAATDPEVADRHFRAAALGPGGQGFAAGGQAAWAWLVNLDHTYLVDECLDLGRLQIEPHGHGYPITSGLSRWQWAC